MAGRSGRLHILTSLSESLPHCEHPRIVCLTHYIRLVRLATVYISIDRLSYRV